MGIKGIYRSKAKVVVFERHLSGVLKDHDYDFLLFYADGRVKSYVGSDVIPVNHEHYFWNSYTGNYHPIEGDGIYISLIDRLSNHVADYNARIIDDQNIELTNSQSGISLVYEKVQDVE